MCVEFVTFVHALILVDFADFSDFQHFQDLSDLQDLSNLYVFVNLACVNSIVLSSNLMTHFWNF